MIDRRRRWTTLALTLALLGLNLAALNYLIAAWPTARIDLTQEREFSISPVTKRLLGSLDEELTIYGYFSKRTHPKLAPLVPQIVDLLDEYRTVGGNKLRVEIVDPGEDDAVEQEASDRYGVHSTPFRLASKYESGIVNAFFALVVKYGDKYERYGFEDLIVVDPLPDGDVSVRLRNLEYDLTRAIKKVVFGFRGTAELFDRIDKPVKLTAIMTPKTMPEMLTGAPDAVRKAADELKQKSQGKFAYEEIDPTGNEPLQQQLYKQFGARPMSLDLLGQGSFYLYGLLDVGGQLEQIVLARESLTPAAIRESIETALRRHTPGFLKTVGVVAPEEPNIPPELRMQLQMPPSPPPEFQQVQEFLRQDYQVQSVRLSEDVPGSVDVLVVLKPKSLGDAELYRLDQYLMRGGRVVLCTGNQQVEFGGQGLSLTPVQTGLDDWLDHFGLAVSHSLVLDDRNQPLPIPEMRQTPFGMLRTWTMAPYPYLVEVRDDGLVNRDITASLGSVGIYWGNPLTVEKAKTGELQVLPILQSSAKSWTSDDLSRVGYVDYEVPAQGTQPQLLAVGLSGRFKSFYAGKNPPGADASAKGKPVTIQESPETRLVVVGNAAFLSDLVAQMIGRMEGGFFAQNLRFVENLIDWITLDNDMVAIRSRGTAPRSLKRTERAQEVTIESANYAIPALLLLGLASWRGWRRRHAAPLLGATRSIASAEPTHGEAG
ncbi:MAG TPA: Gldg family protein [Candidatus Polarisedimenticolaceae bacterium]|nr:Gldg family protein [Candidatus Polarisedimenticolaceae bacterium]